MTYKDLLNTLNVLPPDRLNDNVTVYHTHVEEYSAAVGTGISKESNDVLDEGHFYIVVE